MENSIVESIMTLNDQCCHLRGEEGGVLLSARELRVLRSIAPGESLSSMDMARRNGLSPSRMSRIIDRLVSRGLIDRKEDDNDRRFHRISITPEGIAVNEKSVEFMKQCESRIRSHLSPNEFTIIQKALGLLQFALEEEHGEHTAHPAEHHQ